MATTSEEKKKKPHPVKRFTRMLWNRPLPGTVVLLVMGFALYHQEHLAYITLFGSIVSLGVLFGACTLRVVFIKGVPALFKKK